MGRAYLEKALDYVLRFRVVVVILAQSKLPFGVKKNNPSTVSISWTAK